MYFDFDSAAAASFTVSAFVASVSSNGFDGTFIVSVAFSVDAFASAVAGVADDSFFITDDLGVFETLYIYLKKKNNYLKMFT